MYNNIEISLITTVQYFDILSIAKLILTQTFSLLQLKIALLQIANLQFAPKCCYMCYRLSCRLIQPWIV